MLNIQVSNKIEGDIKDVNAGFLMELRRGIPDTSLNRKLLKAVDSSEYKSNTEVIEHFGKLIDIRCISTGCKAALLVANTNKSVCLVECGLNARDAIILNCTSGSIVVRSPSIWVDADDDTKIDVMYKGHHITTVGELNWKIGWD